MEFEEHQEEFLERNIAWIFGFRRSGTTWLTKMLTSDKTQIWDEPGIGYHLGMLTKMNQRAFDKNQIRNNYFFNLVYQDSWLFFLRKMILHRISKEYPAFNGKFIIKEPNGSLASDLLVQALPKSKFIWMIRDFRDIIDSLLDSMREGGWRAIWQGYSISEDQRILFVTEEANTIKITFEILEKAFHDHSNEFKHQIYYENLMNDTYSELSRIFDFLEISYAESDIIRTVEKYKFSNIRPSLTGAGRVTRSASPGNWRKNLKQEEIEVIHHILGALLKKHGYLF